MADIIDLANRLKALGEQDTTQFAVAVEGTAKSDSSNGSVTVKDDAGDTYECPTSVAVENGQRVIITLVGNSPMVTDVIGWGDEIQAQVDATSNYFRADEAGAHIGTVEGNPNSGNNVLIDADGMKVRDGTTELATFRASLVELGKNADDAIIKLINDSCEMKREADIFKILGADLRGLSMMNYDSVSAAWGSSIDLSGYYGISEDTAITISTYNNTGADIAYIYLQAYKSGYSDIQLSADSITANGSSLIPAAITATVKAAITAPSGADWERGGFTQKAQCGDGFTIGATYFGIIPARSGYYEVSLYGVVTSVAAANDLVHMGLAHYTTQYVIDSEVQTNANDDWCSMAKTELVYLTADQQYYPVYKCEQGGGSVLQVASTCTLKYVGQ